MRMESVAYLHTVEYVYMIEKLEQLNDDVLRQREERASGLGFVSTKKAQLAYRHLLTP